tara:strand:- start:56 stop:1279 length:1224 start_codon:yes stop_codon:yes gene_type:complete
MTMIFGKRIYTSGNSLSRIAWKRFKKNSIGVISLGIITIIVLLALLGYLITPDSTPMCNNQVLEISTQKPGFKTDFLLIRKNAKELKTTMFDKMLFGAPSNYKTIPVDAVEFDGDMVVAHIFDQNNDEFIELFNIADVCYPIVGDPIFNDDTMYFMTVNGDEIQMPILELYSQVLDNNIRLKRYILGTDQFGRDLLSRLLIGSRISLSVGAISVAISLLVGIFLGSMAGFYRGRTDDIIMWFINVVWSIPTLLLVIAITFALGRGFWQIFVAVGLTMWVEVARVVRGQIMSIREKEFVEAGFALGYSNFRIIFKHILPNIMSPVIVISAANFAAAILIEAGLSFLGIGVQPPMPSWGSMIKEYYSFIILDSAYLAIVPGIAIVILVLAFMSLGNALRDTLDVKMQSK